MELSLLIGILFLGASFGQPQRRMPPVIPNQGPGVPPGARVPNQGPGVPPGARVPNQGTGLPIGARVPIRGPGVPPGARVPNQGSGVPPGARVPNQGPGVPPGARIPNQGPGIPPGARSPQRPGPNTNINIPTRSNPRGVVPQIPGGTNNAAPCTSTGRGAILRCFQTNGGFTMQNVVAVLSEGAQGPIPRNAAQITSGICRNQGSIIACVFGGINSLRNTPQCSNVQEFVRMEQETIGLVSGIQQMCGKGPLPTPDSCHRHLNINLRQCYSKAGLNPDLFIANSSAVLRAAGPNDLIGTIIGSDAKMAGKFCRVKTRLFECMKQTIEKCSGAMELMALSGYEQEALQRGIDVLCHDVGIYVNGLRCFQNPSPEVQGCYSTLVAKLSDLSAEQLRKSLPLSQYNNRYCQLRLQHMNCDMASWKDQCTRRVVGLKNEFECNILPSTCKNDRSIQTRLQQTCAIEKFERQLRSGSSSRYSMFSLTMTIISVIAVLLVL